LVLWAPQHSGAAAGVATSSVAKPEKVSPKQVLAFATRDRKDAGDRRRDPSGD
jgi:hypothetical protein